MNTHPTPRNRLWKCVLQWVCAAAPLIGGCNAFNPAFLNLVSSGTGVNYSTLPNSPGYVVLAFVNNAEIDEQLISYVESLEGSDISDAVASLLHPRIRFRLRATFPDGSFQVVEMIDGSTVFVDPSFPPASQPDLIKNDLNNVVFRCDVASVELEPGTSVEVFIPVTVTGYELVETTVGDQVTNEFQPRTRTPPGFRALQVDDIDADGNVVLQRNIGVRDVLSPITNVVCGSVVAVTLNGVLSVPFLTATGVPYEPSYDQADEPTVATIGGRYSFIVAVQ